MFSLVLIRYFTYIYVDILNKLHLINLFMYQECFIRIYIIIMRFGGLQLYVFILRLSIYSFCLLIIIVNHGNISKGNNNF